MSVNGYESPQLFELTSNQQHVIKKSPGTKLIIPTQNFPQKKTLQDRTIVFLEEEKTREGSFKISGAERHINNTVIPRLLVRNN
jgi:hypothetical protein